MTRAASAARGVNDRQRELTPQLTLSIEPSIVDRWPTLREYIHHRIGVQAKLQKHIAADMNISPGLLSKKSGGDPQHPLTSDDIEGYLASTGDVMAVMEYLGAKFAAGGDEARKARIMAGAESAVAALTRLMTEMKESRA